jgi:hypothetical protein
MSVRTFSLNSAEAYEALCPRQDRPWIPNGALPRESHARDREVIVEAKERSPCSSSRTQSGTRLAC